MLAKGFPDAEAGIFLEIKVIIVATDALAFASPGHPQPRECLCNIGGSLSSMNWVFSAWWRHQMETFSRYWPFVRGIHRSPMDSPHKGQWRGAFVFPLICAWINGWVNTREAGDLDRHRAHSFVYTSGQRRRWRSRMEVKIVAGSLLVHCKIAYFHSVTAEKWLVVSIPNFLTMRKTPLSISCKFFSWICTTKL